MELLEETIDRLKIGFADNVDPSAARTLMDGPGAFTPRDLTAMFGIPSNAAGRCRPVLRWPDRFSLLEPRPRRVHDRTPDSVDAGSRVGEIEVQEARRAQRPQ